MMPPNPYADFKRDGMDKVIALAKTLCRLILTFEVVIRAKYGDNIAIIALLEAVKNLCGLLPAEDAEFQAIALDTTLPPENPAEIGGIDPSAPPAEEPDFEIT
jgi:hypothetical protein